MCLTDESIIIYDGKLNKILEFKEHFNDFKIISSKILFIFLIKIFIYYHDENKKSFNTLNDFNYKAINSNNNMVQINKKNIRILDKKDCYFINIENFEGKNLNHDIDNPEFIYKINDNLIIIGNKFNQYNIKKVDIGLNKLQNFEVKKKRNIFNGITSLIWLKNGNIIITTSTSNNNYKMNNGFSLQNPCLIC